MCTLLSTKSIARGWEPVRDATVTKPNPLTSRLWGSHAAAKNPHPTGTYLIRLPFMGPPMVTHAGRGHNICQESRNTSKLPLTLSRVWHIGVANPRRRVPSLHPTTPLKKQKTKDKRNLHRPSEGRRSHLCEPVRMRAVQVSKNTCFSVAHGLGSFLRKVIFLPLMDPYC